jgi:predicted phosphoribosyltransferase
MAVGEWYRSFGQASDDDVVAALESQEQERPA